MAHRELKQLEAFILTTNCIIAELYRVGKLVPEDFLKPTSSHYSKLLVDFSYFEGKSLLEKFIEESKEGRALEALFCEQYGTFLGTFAKLLNATCRLLREYVDYTDSLGRVIDPLFGGHEHTFHMELLRCQSLYLLGVLVLLIDAKFPGASKEYLFVACYRLGDGFHNGAHLEQMVALLRNRKEPYEVCLRNVGVNRAFAQRAIQFLRQCEPSSTERSLHHLSADRLQAMLYSALLFDPETLDNQHSTMRQIVDRHFSGVLVLQLHLELRVTLREKWSGHKAASTALERAHEPNLLIKSYAATLLEIGSLQTQIPTGGHSVEAMNEYAEFTFKYNRLLKWLVVNTPIYQKQIGPKAQSHTTRPLSSGQLLSFTTKIAFFEYKIRQSSKWLIEKKIEECERLKASILVLLDQIVIILASPCVEMSQEWNEKLREWLQSIRLYVAEIDTSKPESLHPLNYLPDKFQEVAEVHAHGTLAVMAQYLTLIATKFSRLLSVCTMSSAFVERLDEQNDSTYLFMQLNQWLPHLELMLKCDPLSIKYFFLKIESSLDNLLLGVDNPDKRAALSSFYHAALGEKLISTIQVIPRAIFQEMGGILSLLVPHFPPQIEKEKLRRFADLDRRKKLGAKIYEITKLSLGISNLSIRRLGSVEIRSRRLLFDGLRLELRRRLKEVIVGSADGRETANIIAALRGQAHELGNLRRGFLFVCDHIGVNGLSMWSEEAETVLGSVFKAHQLSLTHEQLVTKQVGRNPSPKTSDIAGRVVHFIMSTTDPMTAQYLPLRGEWRSIDGKRLVFSHAFLDLIQKWMPINALAEIHKIITLGLLSHTRLLLRDIERVSVTVMPSTPNTIDGKFIEALASSAEFNQLHRHLFEAYTKVGQIALLRDLMHRCVAMSELRWISTSKATQLDWEDDELPHLAQMLVKQGMTERVIEWPKLRNPTTACVVLFVSLLVFLRSCIPKKSGVRNANAATQIFAVKGIYHVMEGTRTLKTFSRLTTLFLGELHSGSSQIQAILPTKEIHI